MNHTFQQFPLINFGIKKFVCLKCKLTVTCVDDKYHAQIVSSSYLCGSKTNVIAIQATA